MPGHKLESPDLFFNWFQASICTCTFAALVCCFWAPVRVMELQIPKYWPGATLPLIQDSLISAIRVVACLAVTVAAQGPVPAAWAHDQLTSRAEPVSVTATPVPFNPLNVRQTHQGNLRFVAGFSLTADRPRFGGYSGLLVDQDGGRLLAVSDAAHFLSLELQHDSAGVLTGVGAGRLYPMVNTQGREITNKRRGDAESLARNHGGAILIGLEDRNEVWRFRGPGTRPRAITAPPGLKESGRNAGLEAMARLADGRLIALTETLDDAGRARGWIGNGRGRWSTFRYQSRDNYHPTGAAPLPDGDLLLLERNFFLLSGFTFRLLRVDADAIHSGALVEGELLGDFKAPVVVDNMEGVDVRVGPMGQVMVYLIADNNFQPLQRTLLLQFVLE